MIWVVIAVAVIGAAIALAASWRRADEPADLGAVSHQWIAEHRLGGGSDWRR
jgi:hypothetical protein